MKRTQIYTLTNLKRKREKVSIGDLLVQNKFGIIELITN